MTYLLSLALRWCRPTEEELVDFGRPDFTLYNAGGAGALCKMEGFLVSLLMLVLRWGAAAMPGQHARPPHLLTAGCLCLAQLAGAFPANRFTSYMTSETSLAICFSKREVVSCGCSCLGVLP